MNPLTLLKLVPWVLLAAACIFAGVEGLQIRARDVTIAKQTADMAGMKAQQAENIAAAQKAARDAMQADIDKGNAIAADLRRDLADQTEKRNAAEVSLAAVQVAPAPPGCPEPMSLPVVGSFIAGLPNQ